MKQQAGTRGSKLPGVSLLTIADAVCTKMAVLISRIRTDIINSPSLALR